MKITTLLTCLAFVFGWATELLAQFVPVIAKQRSIHYLIQSDETEVEVIREEGSYFRSSTGSVLDTRLQIKGPDRRRHVSVLMDSSTRKTYDVDHNLKEAILKQVRPEPFRPIVLRPELAIDEGVIGGLDCLAMTIGSPGNPERSSGKVWWAKDALLAVKRESTFSQDRVVWELYDIRFTEPEPSVFRLPADYKIDDSTWTEETVLEIYAAGTPKPETPAGAEGEVSRAKQRGTLPDVALTRLDGVEERLSDYRGRIVLLDFWATWCGPCVAALPKIRELVAKLPADRFALVGISVDEELGTVTRFVEDEPMPWTNWHAGEGSELARLLRIRSLPTYVLADENGKILTRTGGLIPPFISLVEEAVDHLGKFGSTRRLDVESMALRAGLRDPDTRGGGAEAMRPTFYRMAVVFGVAAVLLLTIGLRGLLTKRPFLFPAWWLFLFIMPMFLSPMVTLYPFSWLSQTMDWIPLLMLLIMAVFMWIQLKGYLAFGVTERSLREGLLAALEKLQLPCEESLSSIRLTSLGVDLQVAIQSWMGSGQIKVRKGHHGPLLKEIVQAMHTHFRTSAVETNMISCVLYLILGIMMLLVVVVTVFRWGPL